MTKFNLQKHHRRSIRLKNYDYSQEGAYYVTIVILRRECLLGQIVNKKMILNPYGEIVQKWWEEIPVHFLNVETGAFVIMPNHVHGIIYILDERRGAVPAPENDGEIKIPEIPAPEESGKNTISQDNDISGENLSGQTLGGQTLGGETPPLQVFDGKPTLGQIVAYFKYQSTKDMNKAGTANVVTKFWQRNYYEHIIRDEKDLQNKTDYIEANPSLWDEDDENPVNGKK